MVVETKYKWPLIITAALIADLVTVNKVKEMHIVINKEMIESLMDVAAWLRPVMYGRNN